MTFHVGQKVVCVDDVAHYRYSPPNSFLGPTRVSAGDVYVVDAVGVHPINGVDVVWLRGIFRGADRSFENTPLAAARFRPFQEKGMSILRSIVANPKRELEVAQ